LGRGGGFVPLVLGPVLLQAAFYLYPAQPFYYNHKELSAGLPTLSHFGAVFPFGHGLSYTRFTYSDPMIDRRQVPTDGEVSISCTVTNSGDRTGDEIVQLYVCDRVASVTRPLIELKGFVRVSLDPGETARVTFQLHADLFSFHGLAGKRVVEPGEVDIMIGASSADIRMTDRIVLVGDRRNVPERRRLETLVDVLRQQR
jgi:beta-glucosidase